MAESITKLSFSVPQGQTVDSNWIDVSSVKRLRLLIGPKPGGKFFAAISQSTWDPAQNTPVVSYEDQFVCGQTETLTLIPQSAIFDRQEQFGANHIKISVTNASADPDFDVFLLTETP